MSRNTYYHGVVTPERLAVGGPLASYSVIDRHTSPKVTDLLNLAHDYNLNKVWVAPGTTLSHCDPLVFKNASPEEWDCRYTEIPANARRLAHMKRTVGWRVSGTFEEKRMIEIIFPEQTTWLWDESDPLTLLNAIQDMEADLAIPIDSHPGSVGRELMKWAVHKDCQIVPSVDLSQLPCKCAKDFAWKRPIIEKGMYLHAYDKNSMYLSAASGAGLGIGDPTYYYGYCTPDLNLAGLWRVDASPHFTFDNSLTKPLVRSAKMLPWPLAEGQEWVTTPILKCLGEMGARVTVIEGWQWPLTRRALGGTPKHSGWAEMIWALRAKYKADTSDVGRVKYNSMKRIATASIGLLGSDKNPALDKAWARPDWWSTIIETAKARILYNIDSFGREAH